MDFKVGDYVRSEKLDVEGLVKLIEPCDHEGCDEETFVLDKEGKIQEVFHIFGDDFEVLNSSERV